MENILDLSEEKSKVDRIVERWPVSQFMQKANVFYKGQVPNVCFLLVSGSAEIKKNRTVTKVEGPYLIGYEDLINQNPSKVCVTLNQGAEACIIDRSSIIYKNEVEEILSN